MLVLGTSEAIVGSSEPEGLRRIAGGNARLSPASFGDDGGGGDVGGAMKSLSEWQGSLVTEPAASSPVPL